MSTEGLSGDSHDWEGETEPVSACGGLTPVDVRAVAAGAGAPMRVVRLEGFEPACALAEGQEREAYLRRFGVLFVDEASARRGGLGQVSRARNARGEEFALKTMLAPARVDGESPEDFEARKRAVERAFREEYETHRSLSGFKGFPRLYGYGTAPGGPAIVMEWVCGLTLRDAALGLAVDGEGRVSPLTAARIGRDLFTLLERTSLVGDGVVHRDVSPANVMVRTNRLSLDQQVAEGAFDLCLIDFGSAAPAEGVAGSSLTQSGVAVRRATVAYAPPEMLTDDAPGVGAMRRSPLVDVYAAASAVFELACGEGPYEAALAARGDRSAYRVKADEAPAPFRGAHAPGCDLESVLRLEPGVAVAAGRAAVGLDVAPGSEELRCALEAVDSQLGDLLAPCLEARQERRPSSTAMRKALSSFCDLYGRNVARALAGEPLLPCADSSEWADAAPALDGRRVLRALALAASAAVWAVALATSSVLVGGTPASLRLGASTLASGRPSALAWAAFFAAPALAAYAARGREGAARAGFVRGTLTLTCCSFAEAGLLALVSLASSDLKLGALATVFALFASAWCPMVVSYAAVFLPALLAEARRLEGRGSGKVGSALGGGSGPRFGRLAPGAKKDDGRRGSSEGE